MGTINLGRVVPPAILPVTSAISTAPTGAKTGDYILNGGAASLTIGGKALTVGDMAPITVLSPLTLGSVAGNIRGAAGANGATGAKGDNGAFYGECTTVAATAAKTADISGFTLYKGARAAIRFSYSNTASAPTMNIAGTGAKDIYYCGTKITNAAPTFQANTIYDIIYTGTYYEIVGGVTGYGY